MMTGNSVYNSNINAWGQNGHFNEIWRPFIHSPARSSLLSFFFLSLLFGAYLSTRFLDSSPIIDSSKQQTVSTAKTSESSISISPPDNKTTSESSISISPPDNKTSQVTTLATENNTYFSNITNPIPETIGSLINIHNTTNEHTKPAPQKNVFPLGCSIGNETQTCPTKYPQNIELDPNAPPPSTCPDHFRYIYEDLRPWSKTGITEDMVMRAKRTANFKLVILGGKIYVERYKKSWQTRDTFTLWGIVQLLRKYPGRVPDLELMFDCVDWPVILARHFQGPNSPAPPPLFRYCKDDRTLDIVFPDWSFWGWAEIDIKPWELLSKELKEGNKKMNWVDREPHAYWKGNPFVAPTRMDLLKCNVSEKQDWHARVYIQDWGKEVRQGFKESDLAHQCIHRYKIYIEGSAWSVSEKYILACDSVPLIVKPQYYDFFSRSLMPMEHYWPIKDNDKCRSIKFAVEWGDSHEEEAKAMGKAASEFIYQDLKMDYIYDYMLHLLNEYAKLLRYKPTIPKNSVEICSETMACSAAGFEKKFMMESMVRTPSDRGPCTMPPPYDQISLENLRERKDNAERQVDKWEHEYWANRSVSSNR